MIDVWDDPKIGLCVFAQEDQIGWVVWFLELTDAVQTLSSYLA